MARRSDEFFDSMSDLVTNLAASLLKLKAGGLILVVMLLLALTREAPKLIEPVRAPGSGKEEGADKPANPLVVRLNKLGAEIAQVDAEIENDRRNLNTLKDKADRLVDKIKAAEAGAAPAPEKK